MNPAQKERLKNDVIGAIKLIPTTTPCAECLHIAHDGFCNKHQDFIPETYLEIGCDQWEEGAPF